MNKVYVSVCILVYSLVISSCGIQEENKIAIRTYPDNIFYLMFGPPSPFVISANDGKKVAHDISYINLDGINFAWSPDGQWIVTYTGDPGNREVYIMTADGLNPRVISPAGGNSREPSFSPDGQWIAFTAYYDHLGDANGCEIYIMRTDGTDLRRLTTNDYCDSQPRWGQ